jgi:hypothetical protein
MSRVRYGRHAALEEVADALIKESLAETTSFKDKSDILTPWKEEDRKRREVYVASGTPDPAIRRGIYHRAWNSGRPDLASREGIAGALPTARGIDRRTSGSSGGNRFGNANSMDSMASFWAEQVGLDQDAED